MRLSLEHSLFALLCFVGATWLVLFFWVPMSRKGLNRGHLLYLSLTTALAVAFFYAFLLERATNMGIAGAWSFPIGAQVLVLATKVATAIWVMTWVIKGKREWVPVVSLFRTGAALNTALVLGYVWAYFAVFR